MKMGIFFGNLFWGVLLILWGISLILKGFGVSLPLAKIFFAIIIIMFGIKLLVGGSCKTKSGIRTSSSGDTIEHTTVFSGQDIDLSHIRPDSKPIEINVVFGNAVVTLPDDVRIDLKPAAVFGVLVTPKQTNSGISDTQQEVNESAPGESVSIKANAIFGKIVFKIKSVKREAPEAPADSTNGGGTEF
ncbi:MAG: hypothetical protein LHW44_07965 [Candidatus Cloacimonetes bacterium]|nr:hypothetical protein [Candidatus Cloacimonadota bacterium]